MKLIFIFISCVAALATVNAAPETNPVEAGLVRWGCDLDAAFVKSKSAGMAESPATESTQTGHTIKSIKLEKNIVFVSEIKQW